MVYASFYSIDPAMGLPTEDGTGRGQGYISYVVRTKPDLPTGTDIRNVATIQFDFGETIATNQVDPHDPSQGTDPGKEALVTIDAGIPEDASRVEPLPATTVASLPAFHRHRVPVPSFNGKPKATGAFSAAPTACR